MAVYACPVSRSSRPTSACGSSSARRCASCGRSGPRSATRSTVAAVAGDVRARRPAPPAARGVPGLHRRRATSSSASTARATAGIGPDTTLSGLEDEYQLAGAAGMPRLLYVKRPGPERDPRLAAMIDGMPSGADVSVPRVRRPGAAPPPGRAGPGGLLTERFTGGGGTPPLDELPALPGAARPPDRARGRVRRARPTADRRRGRRWSR